MTASKEHWERIYTGRSPREVSWYQKEPALSLTLIRRTGLGKDACMLDVGGGASVLVDRLLEQGYTRVAVLDISAHALAYAKSRLGDKARQVEWYEADVTDFEAPHGFLLWHDRAVFHFLTQAADRRRYVEVLKRTVSEGGHVIVAAFAVGGPRRCSGLDVVQYDAEKLRRELGASFRLVEETAEIHLTPTRTAQQFAYFRFVKERGP